MTMLILLGQYPNWKFNPVYIKGHSYNTFHISAFMKGSGIINKMNMENRNWSDCSMIVQNRMSKDGFLD